jgi:CheY-like chemotaxis protein
MENVRILWVDDEIEFLKPHILFLEQKNFHVTTVNNGTDALDLISKQQFDIIFLDENMPGLSGLETLSKIKTTHPNIPIVMITKSEEETIMEDAIGSNISDYLIKPVNPNQILLCVKKNLENKRLISEKTTSVYQQEFREISMQLQGRLNCNEWIALYKRLVYWELELEKSKDEAMSEVLVMQKAEANNVFAKFVEHNYLKWLNGVSEDNPIMSHNLLHEKVLPLFEEEESVFFILIDNLRYDQWKTIQPIFEEYYHIDSDDIYYSILPTATHYARNAIFAGLMPVQIEKKYPELWLNEEDDGNKNVHESELVGELLKRNGKTFKHSYSKVLNMNFGKKVADNISNLLTTKFNVIIYNFVDMLSHARTDDELIRELADNEPAYRSLTLSWFEHSSLLDIIKALAEKKVKIVLTTDHGSIQVSNPVKMTGDKNTNTNLRYKVGKTLNYEKKDVFEVKNPAEAFLPKANVSSSYIFCKENKFFVYTNNDYAHYSNFYKNTFQHGGVSMEEMLIPVITMTPK